MSELVEKVARAIARQRWTEEAADPNLIDAEVEYGWDTYADEARAAIAAVAEWMTTQEHGAGAAVMLTWELKQLEQPKGAAGDGR